MRKSIFITLLALITCVESYAQYHGRYPSGYIARGGRGYDNGANTYYRDRARTYFGLRIGLSASTVSSDDASLDGGSMKAGLSVGAILGVQLSNSTPLCLETGLLYVEKGGKGVYANKNFTYNLNYLEIPFLLKFKVYPSVDWSIQPFLGPYIGIGVGGKIKDYGDRAAYSSFSDGNFRSFDAGLRAGVGCQYNILYMELGYDLGLSNICYDNFDTSRNGALFVNVGVNL